MEKDGRSDDRAPREICLELIDTDKLRVQTEQLLDNFLPHLAADIENHLHEQEAKVFYEIYTDRKAPTIRVVLKLNKSHHEVLVHLDSRNALFVIGNQPSAEVASTALEASLILEKVLMRVSCS